MTPHKGIVTGAPAAADQPPRLAAATTAFEQFNKVLKAMIDDLPNQVERESGLQDVQFEVLRTGAIEGRGVKPNGDQLSVIDGGYLDAALALMEAARQ